MDQIRWDVEGQDGHVDFAVGVYGLVEEVGEGGLVFLAEILFEAGVGAGDGGEVFEDGGEVLAAVEEEDRGLGVAPA